MNVKRTGIALFATVSMLLMCSVAWCAENECFAKKSGQTLILGSGGFKYQIDLSSGVRAKQIENLLTGEKIALGGPECALRFSAADQRIELLGWKQAAGGAAGESPDAEAGFVKTGLTKGFHNPSFDDSKWQDTESPWVLSSGPGGTPDSPNPKGYNWYRVRFDVPDANGKPVTFGLGGCGLYDFGKQRFFLNGILIGTRMLEKPEWQDASLITLKPGDPGYEAIRFGGTNVLSVQAWNQFDCRPTILGELDPTRYYAMARILMLQDQFVTVGPAYQDVAVTGAGKVEILSGKGDKGLVKIELMTSPNLGELTLWYEWISGEPALRKWLEFKNTSGKELLLLDVDLGDYKISVPASEGFRGFPVHLDDQMFLSIAHPCGVAQGSAGRVRLRHFPGKYIKPGEVFTSKQAVYGMGKANGARQAFWDYLLQRAMRVATHDGVTSSIHYDGLAAAWGRPGPWGDVDPVSESTCLSIMDKMAEFKSKFGLQFDYFWLDAGWWEYEKRNELLEFNHAGFPSGPAKTVQRAKELGMNFGIWTSRGSGDCTVPDDARNVYKNAIDHHIKSNGVSGLKFDGQQPRCWRKDHVDQKLHLPGKYSTEAFQDANIDIYSYGRELCPDIWIYGYWGHDSPWWLMYVSTTFDHGLNMEMQTPCKFPMMYDRDSKLMAMDQAAEFRSDMPPRGRDSLGVWMTEGWAPFGHERWLENVMIDICRGPGILHLWADIRKFSDEDARMLSRLTKVLKDFPIAFANSRIIIGDPWKGEPYGYSCSDAERAFIVVHNPTFEDRRIEVKLDESIGLTKSGEWTVYRHAPNPAKMEIGRALKGGDTLSWHVRPAEFILIELAPVSKGPALADGWGEDKLAVEPFSIQTRPVELSFEQDGAMLRVQGELPACPVPSTLVMVGQPATRVDGKIGGQLLGKAISNDSTEVMTSFEQSGKKKEKGYSINATVVRIPLEASDKARDIDLYLTGPQAPGRKVYLLPVSYPAEAGKG